MISDPETTLSGQERLVGTEKAHSRKFREGPIFRSSFTGALRSWFPHLRDFYHFLIVRWTCIRHLTLNLAVLHAWPRKAELKIALALAHTTLMYTFLSFHF